MNERAIKLPQLQEIQGVGKYLNRSEDGERLFSLIDKNPKKKDSGRLNTAKLVAFPQEILGREHELY